MGKKDKQSKNSAEETVTVSEELLDNSVNLSPIAHPLASTKLQKKIFKAIKKATKAKHIRRGVREVAKSLRKGEKGIVILAGDISPIDVISHLPVVCEEANVPYCYVNSKRMLGESGLSKRPTSVIMLSEVKKKGADYEEYYDACKDEISKLAVMPSATTAAGFQ